MERDDLKWLDKYIDEQLRINGHRLTDDLRAIAEAIELYGDDALEQIDKEVDIVQPSDIWETFE